MEDKRLTGWTEERVAKLKELCASKKYTAAKIAEILGGVSRNAVCGKIHRLGLAIGLEGERESVARSHKSKSGRDNGQAFAIISRVKAKAKTQPEVQVPLRVVHDAFGISPRHIGLMDLNEATCHWPYGNGPVFTFCGCQSLPKKPYCYAHNRAAHNPEGTAAFGSEEHRRKLSEAQKARHARRASA